MCEPANVVIAVDPGRSKCGLAVVRRRQDGPGSRTAAQDTDAFEVLHRAVIIAEELAAGLTQLAAQFHPDALIVGNGTSCRQVLETARGLGLPRVELVDERFSSLDARRRYFRDNPPRGLRRLLPISLQSPGRPHDDYVAVILAERYLSSTSNV
jgi:RNase H-fold protein (predicted Holliday junction resolvase)